MNILRRKWILIVAGIVFLGLSFTYVISNGFVAKPYKVTDPADPQFDPMAFRFEDYNNKPEIAYVTRELFPIGTKKAKVEGVLIKNANAKTYELNSNKNHVVYVGYSRSFLSTIIPYFRHTYRIEVYYDSNENLKHIGLNGYNLHTKEILETPRNRAGE